MPDRRDVGMMCLSLMFCQKFVFMSRLQDMSKLMQLNEMWKNKGSSGHGQELPSGVRESSFIENPDAHDDIRTHVGYIVATQARRVFADA